MCVPRGVFPALGSNGGKKRRGGSDQRDKWDKTGSGGGELQVRPVTGIPVRHTLKSFFKMFCVSV